MAADVFLSAGEASGDLQASLLLSALRRTHPDLTARAAGGDRLRAAGADVLMDSVAQEWASIGHLRAYARIPWLLSVMLRLAERLLHDPPRLLVCVDFGAFNLRMLEWLRFRGYRGKAVYYFPPGAWFSNADQAKSVARVSTPVTPFRRQAEFYRGLGLRAEWFGHPLVSTIAARPARAISDPPLVAVMPGSRDEEISRHLGILSGAATSLRRSIGARFRVIAASAARERELREAWPDECGGAAAVVAAQVPDAIADADVAWVASGTAVLETALRAVPQIAFYRIGEAEYRIAARRAPHIVRGPITLPNLVTGRSIVPELLQDRFDAARLADLTKTLLRDDAMRRAQLAGDEELRRDLGPPDALERIGAFCAGVLDEAAR